MPAVRTKLTISAPTSAPCRLPSPPITTTTKARMSASMPMPSTAGWAGTDEGPAEPRHETADRERRDVDQSDIESQRRSHAAILRRRAQHDTKFGAVDHRPEADRGGGTDRDDHEVVAGIDQAADVDAGQHVHHRVGGQRQTAPQQANDVLEYQQQAERDQQLVFLGAAVKRAQQRLDHDAEQRDRASSHRNQEKGPSGGYAERNGAPDQPRRDEGADGVERAVRHVDDAHDAEDQAKAGSDQKKNRGVEQRIEDLDDEDGQRPALLQPAAPAEDGRG